MPRPDRVFVEGGVYHVYNRLGRGESVFEEDAEASVFVDLLRDVTQRDGLTVFAWCLMANHYHLALRTGTISLDRPMRSLQQRVTRGVNLRRRLYGPLWQGRYRAKLVDDQRYLDQLLIYIHLNPVKAGIVNDPADYRWSGHRELMTRSKNPVIEADEVLRVFGNTRRSAQTAYIRGLRGSVEKPWSGEEPGHLPWWRLGRPPRGENEDPEAAVRRRREREEQGPDWRPSLETDVFVILGAELIGVEVEELRSRRKNSELARARELLIIAGVEHYGLRVKDLAHEFRKSPNGMTKVVARASRKRTEDARFREDLHKLDRDICRSAADK